MSANGVGAVVERRRLPRGLPESTLDFALVALLVLTLFLERLDKDAYDNGFFPIPDLTFCVAAICLMARLVWLHREGVRFREVGRRDRLLAFYVGALGVTSLSVLAADSVTRANGLQVVKTYAHLCVFLAAALALGRALTPSLLRFALIVFFVLGVVTAMIGVLQALDQNALHLGMASALHLNFRETVPGSFIRPTSVFSEPAYFGYTMTISAVIGVLLVARINLVLGVGGAVLCCVALLLSGSAGATAFAPVVALYLAVGVLRWPSRNVLVGHRRRIVSVSVVSLIVLVGFLTITPAGSTLLNRAEAVLNGSDQSAQLRHAQNSAALTIWKRDPVTGVGLGETRLYMPQLVHVSFMPADTVMFESANAYLALLAEAGPVGIGGLVLILGILFAPYPRRDSVGDPLERISRTVILLIALEFLLIGGFLLPPLWFWAGVRLSLETRSGLESSSARRDPSVEAAISAVGRRERNWIARTLSS
jgi:hypothetical protein